MDKKLFLLPIAEGLFCISMIIVIWAGKKKKVFIPLLVVTMLCFAGVAGEFIYNRIEESKVVKSNISINVDNYLPFSDDSKIARLDHEASIKLEDSLPRLDGAAAAFPVYSAFVNAVYPESAGKLCNQGYEAGAFNYFNTVAGYKMLIEGNTDIFFGAYPSQEQLRDAKLKNIELEFTPIGKEAFIFFVPANSDVDNLSSEQIRQIYSGKVRNWSELGFKKRDIVAYQRNEGSGSQSTFLKFMGDVRPEDAPTEKVSDFMMGIYDRVADYKNNKGSIGFSFRYYFETIVNRKDVKMISVDGVYPNIENIENGSYPITGYLYAVTVKDNPNPNIKVLLDWILSEEGQELIVKTGYAGIN